MYVLWSTFFSVLLSISEIYSLNVSELRHWRTCRVTSLANVWSYVTGERVGVTSLVIASQIRHLRTSGNYVTDERVGITSLANVWSYVTGERV
jgi:hypothetical protein